jgi:hypothetical protein
MKNGKILREISTHKAVVNGDKIDIILTGFVWEDSEGKIEMADQYQFSIPLEDADDLIPLFDGLAENNRSNVAEFMQAIDGK